MFDYSLTFGSPWYLLILAILPPLWWYSFRRLAALGRWRRLMALGLRSLLIAIFAVAMAEVQMVRTSNRLTVIYLLDQSQSIPEAQRRAMIEYVNAEVRQHRRDEDKAGVIVFGREAAIEIPPFDDVVDMAVEIESLIDSDFTNLAGAMRLAQASFPEDAARRIVLISDGNENLGNVTEQTKALAGSGIGVDIVPIRYDVRSDIVVERLVIPSDVRRGEPFLLNAVINNTTQPKPGESGTISGRLQLVELVDGRSVPIYDQRVELPPGKKVFSIPQRIDASSFYKYEVTFVPDEGEEDAVRRNNRATAFTHVRGEGKILLIENSESPGEFDTLVGRLQRQGLEVTVMPSDQLFTELGELQQFDTVVLANVPRATDKEDVIADVVGFSDEQIRMLVRNTQQFGAGLVMLGGVNSFGPGGWTGTELEEAMPVDFQIRNAKVAPRGALVLLMHASEMAQGNHWQKVIAEKALEALGPQDYCGLLHWNGSRDVWLWSNGLAPVSGMRRQMMARVSKMIPGDMPYFEPAMQQALLGFRRADAKAQIAIKHMVIISDGDPPAPNYGVGGSVDGLIKENVTVSTVTVGAHGKANSRTMKRIADTTGGKYYAINNAKALPRIFQREARRVSRPLIYKKPINPEVLPGNQMVQGLDARLPTIEGFVKTSVKENPLVEVSIQRPADEADPKYHTILASWTYGLGKAVAFTSDAGYSWTAGWTGTELYDRLFTQIIRYSMRPTGGSTSLMVATDVEDGRISVVTTALGKDDEFINLHTMTGRAVGPDLKSIPFELKQTAPGRYIGDFPAHDAGSYHLMISSINPQGEIAASVQTGMNLPYSDEFRDRAANDALLGELRRSEPVGGKPGLMIEAEDEEKRLQQLLQYDTFRPGELAKATSSQDIWHVFVLLGSCLFFFDVLVRRVQLSLTWVPPLVGRVRDTVLRREPKQPEPEYIGRLRSRKAEVSDRIEQLRSDARFEAPEDAPSDLSTLDETAPSKPAAGSLTPEQEEETYTERLLRAKKKVQEDRGEDE